MHIIFLLEEGGLIQRVGDYWHLQKVLISSYRIDRQKACPWSSSKKVALSKKICNCCLKKKIITKIFDDADSDQEKVYFKLSLTLSEGLCLKDHKKKKNTNAIFPFTSYWVCSSKKNIGCMSFSKFHYNNDWKLSFSTGPFRSALFRCANSLLVANLQFPQQARNNFIM